VLNPVQFLLYSMSRPDLSTASDAVIAILFAVLAALLTPSYSAHGTAWALFGSQTSIKLIMAWGIIRYLKRAITLQKAAELEPEYSALT
jgi:O-antigen/teichoic acid export membrane protein